MKPSPFKCDNTPVRLNVNGRDFDIAVEPRRSLADALRMSDEKLREVLSSNLCRCTGYQNIVRAVRAAAKKMRGA